MFRITMIACKNMLHCPFLLAASPKARFCCFSMLWFCSNWFSDMHAYMGFFLFLLLDVLGGDEDRRLSCKFPNKFMIMGHRGSGVNILRSSHHHFVQWSSQIRHWLYWIRCSGDKRWLSGHFRWHFHPNEQLVSRWILCFLSKIHTFQHANTLVWDWMTSPGCNN